MKIEVQRSRPDVVHNALSVFPVLDAQYGKQLWQQYLETLKRLRNETPQYLHINLHYQFLQRPSASYDIVRFSASHVYFQYPWSIPIEVKSALNVTGNQAPLYAWYDGAEKYITGMKEVIETRYLNNNDDCKMQQIRDLLAATFSS